MQILQQPVPSPLVRTTINAAGQANEWVNLLQIGTTCCKNNTFRSSCLGFSNAQLQLLKVKGMMLLVVLIFFDFPSFTRQTRWQK
ncbi:hypothetical protein [Massilia sp. S19_KUP03_FR1]|uniref:hypothetical protein n=1 Tax=Massilia sp. S19_KUP03_FR1 TaxID=3025503 RepID=UPI002FCDD2EB